MELIAEMIEGRLAASGFDMRLLLFKLYLAKSLLEFLDMLSAFYLPSM
jgi:hypothetical protein